MVPLGVAARVAGGGVLGRWAVDGGCVVVGVAQARSGQFGQHRLDGGADLGGEPAAELRHAVGALVPQGQPAAPGAVLVGVVAVWVEVTVELSGDVSEVVGSKLGGQPGQLLFGAFSGAEVHGAG